KKHYQSKHQIHRSDIFVISGKKPAAYSGWFVIVMIVVEDCFVHNFYLFILYSYLTKY
ncbi:uncharacterized protein METZ01_LOCUS278195, partial [marine metagenome]